MYKRVNVFTIRSLLSCDTPGIYPPKPRCQMFPIFTLIKLSFSEKIFWRITGITQINHRSFKNFMGSPCDLGCHNRSECQTQSLKIIENVSIHKDARFAHIIWKKMNKSHINHLSITYFFYKYVAWNCTEHCVMYSLVISKLMKDSSFRRSFSPACDSVRTRGQATHTWTFWQCWSSIS